MMKRYTGLSKVKGLSRNDKSEIARAVANVVTALAKLFPKFANMALYFAKVDCLVESNG